MLQKLELDSLMAEVAGLEALLESRSEEDDPVGWFQLSSRKSAIQAEIQTIENVPDTLASIGLFFGGRPVFGSKGINATFAGKVIDSFQMIVSKRFSSLELGPLAARGPIPMQNNAQLMVTDVARGSFGFILEESAERGALVDTPLKYVVDDVAEMLFKISSPDDDVFESVVEELDDRILATLKQFFQHLDDSGATLRIVEGKKEYQLGFDSVRMARLRTESMEIRESEDSTIVGTIYVLPVSRKFELHQINSVIPIKGNVSAEWLKETLGDSTELPNDIVGPLWKTKMKIREIRERNRPVKFSYTLTGLIEKIGKPS